LFAIDLGTGTLTGTAEFFKLFGLQPLPSIPAAMIDDLVVPEDAAIIANATTRPSERADLNVEYRVRRADTSELRWLERRAELECDDSGAALR
ncbi:PAS domain-containing protein, partial [Staphylococcus aureus]